MLTFKEFITENEIGSIKGIHHGKTLDQKTTDTKGREFYYLYLAGNKKQPVTVFYNKKFKRENRFSGNKSGSPKIRGGAPNQKYALDLLKSRIGELTDGYLENSTQDPYIKQK